MDVRRLSLILILGGAGMTVLALVWFVAAYADAIDMASDFAGDDYAGRLLSCLYSSGPICQGAGMLSDGPGYSPVMFWIGVIALLAGVAMWFAAARGGSSAPSRMPAAGTSVTDAPGVLDARAGVNSGSGEILGFIPPGQYARYCYILALSGAAGGLLLTPLAVIALAALVLALLGLTVYRPQLSVLDAAHLGLICLIGVAAGLLLWLSRGTFLFLLVALVQIAAFYVAFNSYRHGRLVTVQNLKQECLLALKRDTAAGTPADRSPNPTE